jgi:hypothetical protein
MVRDLGPNEKPCNRTTRIQRSSVDRIARRAGLTRLCLGEGRNGIVRFIRKEVEAYEASRRVTP